MNDKYFIKAHIYTVISFISKFAFFLILPSLQIIIFGKIETAQSLLTLALCAAVIIYAVIRRRNEFFIIGKKHILINRGVVVRSQKLIKNEKINTLNIRRGIISGAIFGAAEVFLDVPSTFRDIKTSFYINAGKARRIFCEKAYVLYKSEFKKILLSAVLWSNSITGFLSLIPIMNNVDRLFGRNMAEVLYKGISVTEYLVYAGISPAVAIVSNIIIICFLISVVKQVNEYFGFELGRGESGQIYINRGLFKRNFFVFKPEAVNSICIRQNMYMLPFNLCCSFIDTVSSNKIKGDMSLLVPPENEELNHKLLSEIFNSIDSFYNKKAAPVKGAISAYKYPLFARAFITSIAVITCSEQGFYGEIIAGLLCFILFFIILRLIFVTVTFKRIGIKINDCYINTTAIKKYYTEVNYIPLSKVQKIETSRNIFQRHMNRCNVKIYIFSEKKKYIHIKHMPYNEVKRILGL